MAARFAFETHACDVDAASGEKFLFGGEVERGKSEFAAGTGAADDFAGEGERAAE